MIEIIDNFLHQRVFDEMQNYVLSEKMCWFACKHTDYEEDNQEKFSHTVFDGWKFFSPLHEDLKVVYKQLNSIAITRARFNLHVRHDSPRVGNFHIDNITPTDQKVMVGVLYFNTNNGYTEFEDGTKVDCIANRFVKFPMNTHHRLVTQTDEPFRVVLNINWVPL